MLSEEASSRYFDRDPHVMGRFVSIAGQSARMAGVVPANAWRFPGPFDAWLLESLEALPPGSRGFVPARLNENFHPRTSWFGEWRLKLRRQSDDYEAISSPDCAACRCSPC